MTLYLMRDAGVLPAFFDLAQRLRQADRFFADRRAHLSGPFEVRDRWVSPRVKVSAAAVPHRPARGIYVVVGPPVDGAAMVAHQGVAGAWAFTNTATDAASRQPPQPPTPASGATSPWPLSMVTWTQPRHSWANGACNTPDTAGTLEWAGPLDLLDRVNPIDTDSYDWFDRLTPQ